MSAFELFIHQLSIAQGRDKLLLQLIEVHSEVFWVHG